MGWYRTEYTFIPIPHECVERSAKEADIKTIKSQEGSPVEHRKSGESNPVLHTVEVSPTKCGKSWERNPVVSTVRYAKIMTGKVLLS